MPRRRHRRHRWAHRSEPDRRGRLLAVLVGLVAVGLVTIETSQAAFSATTHNDGNRLAAGVVTVTDDAAGSAMFDLPAMRPGIAEARCINVTYRGSVPSEVRLLTTSTGGFAAYLTTRIEVGTGAAAGATFDCSGFVADTSVFEGTLADLGASHGAYESGLPGFGTATTGTTRSFRITTTMLDDDAAQGLSTTTTFTWEGRPA